MNSRYLFPLVLCVVLASPGCATKSSGPPATAALGDAGAEGGGARADGRATHRAAATEPSETTAPVPDFSGFWVLNAEASDDPQEKISQLRSSMAGGQGMHGGSGGRGRGGGGMGGGGQGRHGGGMKANHGSSFGNLSFSVLETLEISHEDPMLTIVGPDERRQRIFTDFRGASISTNGGLQQQVTVAGWEDGVLVVETTPDSGPRLIQRYQLDRDARQLVLVSMIVVPQRTKPLIIRSVYQAADTEAPNRRKADDDGGRTSSPSALTTAGPR